LINLNDLVINKNSPIPLYYQIEEYFRKKVKNNEIIEGCQIPTEKELMQALGVSRITVRKAMDNLLRDGLIEIRKGHGTFVATKQFYEPVAGIRSYTEEALKQGFTPSTKILKLQKIKPPEDVAKNLNISEKDNVYEIIRLRLLDQKPTGYDVTYIPEIYVPGLSKDDFKEYGKGQSLYNLLEEKYNLTLAEAEETISATLTNKKESEHLGLNYRSPINLRKRVVFLPNKKPLLYMKSIYKTSYKTRLKGRPSKAR